LLRFIFPNGLHGCRGVDAVWYGCVLVGMKMPKKEAQTETYFRAILPNDPSIVIKPMFGHIAAFVNGNMFAGTFGSEVFVRLGEKEGSRLLRENGSKPFAPMQGRPMKGYIVMPSDWIENPSSARSWVAESLEWTRTLPPKEKKKKTKGGDRRLADA
jgi:TfoX/Sxy family transcriptional regulator of competence genes